jgi:tRNA pseudouridine38-40 synthase
MRNMCLLLSYDGTDFHGWQFQPNLRTAEGTLKDALARILGERPKLYAAARTDQGVHAKTQVVNFATERGIPVEGLIRGLNSLLPADIRVLRGGEVPSEFHARYSAKSKTYRYFILTSPLNSPFLRRYTLHVPQGLHVEGMQRAIQAIVGVHDFSAFTKKSTSYRNPVRRVLSAKVKGRGEIIVMEIRAEGFLRYMVRNIVGTLLLVGKGKIDEEGFKAILESRDRDMAGPTAPPHGLFLWDIEYEPSLLFPPYRLGV